MNSIETELKKNGIEVTEKLSTLNSNTLAKNVADKIAQTFPDQDLNANELFARFSRINMYKANIPNGMAEANYFYKNSSVYFRSNIPFEQLEKFAIHEFIHNLQEVKDNKGNLQRLGLCKFSNIKTYGLALNEAAVQFAASKVLNNDTDIVKYYEISLPTISPSYYPIICNLIEQLAYLIGEHTLFNSTFYANDLFEEDCITYLGKKNYIEIQNKFDKILLLEEKIIKVIPKDLVIGIGCRRNTDSELLKESLYDLLEKYNIDIKSIKEIGSIDIKHDEKAIIDLSKSLSIPFKTISANEISKVDYLFEKSEFVKKNVGVYCVSEPVAYILSKGNLIIEKHKYKGITISVGRVSK